MAKHPADWYWVDHQDLAEFFKTMGEMRSEHAYGPYVDSCSLWRFDRLIGKMHRGVFVTPLKIYRGVVGEYNDVRRAAFSHDIPLVTLPNAMWLGPEEMAEADMIIATKGIS